MADWLKMGEVAKIYDVDPKTVGRWCKDGKIPGAIRTPGNQWRVPRAAVEAMIRAKAQAGGAGGGDGADGAVLQL